MSKEGRKAWRVYLKCQGMGRKHSDISWKYSDISCSLCTLLEQSSFTQAQHEIKPCNDKISSFPDCLVELGRAVSVNSAEVQHFGHQSVKPWVKNVSVGKVTGKWSLEFSGSTHPAALLRTALMSFPDSLPQRADFRTCHFLRGQIFAAEY